MIAHINLPGSRYHTWIHGTKKECNEWLDKQTATRPHYEWQGCGLFTDAKAKKIRYRDGQRVYDWNDGIYVFETE
jgi:hypothetical protein